LSGRRRRLSRVLIACLKLLLIVFTLSLLPVVYLRWFDPPSSAFILQYIWREQRSALRHEWVPADELSPHLQLAVIAAEDQRFPFHHGFDFDAIRAALEEQQTGGRLRGASTLTQQTAKNLFLWRDKSLFRKGIEAYFTVLIEAVLDKPRILEVYLNIAEFGSGVYGAEAASLVNFGRSATTLGPDEACLLAAVLPNPTRVSAAEPSRHVRQRQRWICRQMQQLGGLDYLENLRR
jgi:monofunctional biosynthetic peptidoglycan transglycosylase